MTKVNNLLTQLQYKIDNYSNYFKKQKQFDNILFNLLNISLRLTLLKYITTLMNKGFVSK